MLKSITRSCPSSPVASATQSQSRNKANIECTPPNPQLPRTPLNVLRSEDRERPDELAAVTPPEIEHEGDYKGRNLCVGRRLTNGYRCHGVLHKC